MAKSTKTFKTPSAYDIIANTQIQQTQKAQQAFAQKAQDDYNAWLQSQNNQQPPQVTEDYYKSVSDDYNNWLQSQQTAQQPTVNEIKAQSAKKSEEKKAEEQKKEDYKYNGRFLEGNNLKMFGQREASQEQIEDYLTSQGVRQLPTLNDYFKQMESTRTEEKAPVDMNKVKADLENQEMQQSYIDKAKEYLDPNKKLTKEEAKAARLLVAEGTMDLEGRSYKSLTDKEKELYDTMEDLRLKSSGLNSFAVGTADKAMKMGFSLGKLGAISLPGIGNKAVEGLNKLEDKYDETAANARQLANNAAPVASPTLPVINQQVDINPYDLGGMATQMGAYMLTNPMFDKLGQAANLGRAGSFALNQGAQLGQDLLLDTSQVVDDALKDGDITEEEAKAILANVGGNAAFNLVLGLGGEAIKSIDNARAANQLSNQAFADNISEGAEKLAKLNETGYQSPAKLMPEEIADLNQNPIEANNSQFSALMKDFNNEFKDTSAMSNIYDPEDLNAAMSRQLREALQNNPKTELPVMEAPKANTELPKIAETENIKPEIAENTQKAAEKVAKQRLSLPEEVDTQIASDLMQIREASEKMRISAEATGSEQAVAKYNKLADAIEDYERALYYSDDLAEVNKAKKATDAARQALVREIKKTNPDYKAELTGNKIGNAEWRRNPKKAADKVADELGESFAKSDAEVNTNQWVRDAEPDSQIPLKGVEETPKPRNIDPNNLKVNEVNTRKGPRYTVVEQKGNWSTPVDTGKKLYKTKEEAQAAIERVSAEIRQQTIDDDWAALKAGENEPRLKMNLQTLSEETSRADKLLNEIKYGEDAAKNTDMKVSQYRTNSMERNKYAWDSDDLKGLYDEKQFEYLPTSEKTSLENAYNNVQKGRDYLIDRYTKQADKVKTSKEAKKFYDSTDVDQMHLLIRQLRSQERHATDEAAKALYAQQRFEITKHLYDATHSSAAVMQAGQKWLNDAEGILDTAEAIRAKKISKALGDNPKLQKQVNEVAESIYNRFKELEKNNVLVDMSEAEKRAKVREMIEEALENSEVKRRLGVEDIETITNNLMSTRTADSVINGIEDAIAKVGWIKPETIDKVYDIWAGIESLDPGSKEFHKGTKEMYSLLANDLGGSGTFWDKVDAWRYFAMLANPTTHIRNILGNVSMNIMTGTKNNIAAGIEKVADAATKKKGGIQGGRTKAILTLKDGDLVKESGKYFDNHAFTEFAEGGNRYLSASKGIDDAMHTFKNKALDKVVSGHSDLLSAEDVMFGKAKYKTSLAGYLKANGADASIFTAKDAASKELLEKAHKYALDAANEATFHTENAAANALSQFTKNLKESDNVLNKSLGIMIDTTVPFKKTPMNILKNCFEYSPVEFAKVVTDLGKWKRGVIDTSTMVDNLAKAITGTGGMALGALLAHEGIIKVTSGNTSKEQSYDKQSGQQAMALNVFGHDIDLSFLPPAVMPLIMGATLLNDYKEKYGDDYTALDVLTGSLTDPEILGNTALESLDTIVDTTMLSGIDDMINTIRYAENPQDVIKSLATKTATNYASQMIPTLVKKTASVVDGQKYSSYSDKTGAAKTLDSSLKYMKTTVPGLQQLGSAMEKSDNKTIASIGDAITAEPKINGWGESVQKEDYGLGAGGRALDQYLNPATTTKNTEDNVTKQIRELSQRLNDDSVLDIGNIATSESKFSINGNQYKLDEKQWTKYSQIEGQTARKLAETYVGSKDWKNDDDETKAKTLDSMKKFAKSYAQSKVTGEPLSKSNQALADIYKKKDAKGLLEEISTKATISSYGIDDSSGSRAVYNDLGERGLKVYSEAKEKLEGSTAKDNIVKVLDSQGLAKSDKAKYYSYLDTDANPGANPYGYIPGVNYNPEKDTAYQKAKAELPKLDPVDYYKTKDKMDYDGNNSVKQDEAIQYMNEHNISEEDGMKYWKAFGSSNWKKTPVYRNDKWELSE